MAHGLGYVIARSAAICDSCDVMQKPGEVVFGCSSCDYELCTKCALDSAGSATEADESLKLIARVTRMLGDTTSRFVATPSGALLDMKSSKKEAPREGARSGRRNLQRRSSEA